MRPTLALVILVALLAMGSRRVPPAAAQTLNPTTPPPPASEVEMIRWGFTQGGLTLVLIVVLASYRRDFFRKIEKAQSEIDLLREEKRMLRDVMERTADAMLKQAVATSENTKATELLAQNVNNLAERRGPHRT